MGIGRSPGPSSESASPVVSEYVCLGMVQIIQELETSNLDEPRCGPPIVVQE
jgi:hypothetical protein